MTPTIALQAFIIAALVAIVLGMALEAWRNR